MSWWFLLRGRPIQAVDAIKDGLRGAGHLDLCVRLPRDPQLSAPTRDDNWLAWGGKPLFDSGDRHCAGARSAAPRLARAALPNPQPEPLGAFDFAPHQARAVGKQRVALELGAERQKRRVV